VTDVSLNQSRLELRRVQQEPYVHAIIDFINHELMLRQIGTVMFERDTFLKLAFRVKRMFFWVVVIRFEVERLSLQAEKVGGARCVADFY
jgi:hypothetical protein